MHALGRVLMATAALITVLCIVFMATNYLQTPTSRLGADPGFHGAVSSALFPIFIVALVALLSLIFWPKRH
jgi:hypothetical protein